MENKGRAKGAGRLVELMESQEEERSDGSGEVGSEKSQLMLALIT